MGPFDGAAVSIGGLVFFGAVALVIWIFNSGREAARPAETRRAATARSEIASVVVCETCKPCGATVYSATQFEGVWYCDACFEKHQPERFRLLNTSSTNTSSRDNKHTTPTGPGG